MSGKPVPFKATHGMSSTRTYKSWESMRQRCQNPRSDGFPNYGGRGIAVCDRWQSFELFFADMGERPQGPTLGRIDNEKGYFPGNVEWQDARKQALNTRRTVFLIVDGKRVKTDEAARLGVNVANWRAREHNTKVRKARKKAKLARRASITPEHIEAAKKEAALFFRKLRP